MMMSDENRIIKRRGRLFIEQDGKRKFLCSLSPKLIARVESLDDVPIPTLTLTEALPRLMSGLCPVCESKLRVATIGRYECSDCSGVFVNTEGYRLPALMADEIISSVLAGQEIKEFTTVGVASMMPSPMKTKDGTARGICPRCYSSLNQRGECQCGWTPAEIDKLWEQLLSVTRRYVTLTSTSRYIAEFESGAQTCKIMLKEHEDGYRFIGRFINVTDDSIKEIIGRPKAVVNFITERLQPVRPVNSPQGRQVNTPNQESGHRLSPRKRGRDIRVGYQRINHQNLKGES